MIGAIARFFEAQIAAASTETGEEAREHAYQLAAAALLVEMARADFDVKPAEDSAVAAAVRRAFDLSSAETDELLKLAARQAEDATSLYEFTRLINQHLGDTQKEHLVELLWEVAFADGELDRYEEHLVRKVAELIYVPHSAFIRAKHRALERVS